MFEGNRTVSNILSTLHFGGVGGRKGLIKIISFFGHPCWLLNTTPYHETKIIYICRYIILLDRSITRSLARSLDPSVARSRDRLLGRSIVRLLMHAYTMITLHHSTCMYYSALLCTRQSKENLSKLCIQVLPEIASTKRGTARMNQGRFQAMIRRSAKRWLRECNKGRLPHRVELAMDQEKCCGSFTLSYSPQPPPPNYGPSSEQSGSSCHRGCVGTSAEEVTCFRSNRH